MIFIFLGVVMDGFTYDDFKLDSLFIDGCILGGSFSAVSNLTLHV